MPSTRIRHRDVRLVLPGNPGVDQDERILARGRYFEADCQVTDLPGDFVFMSGDPVAAFRQVTKVDPLDGAKMPAAGLILSKSSTTRCLVQVAGEIAATGLATNQQLWIGSDGRISATHPVPSAGQIMRVQTAGIALEPTVLLLRLGTLLKLRG